jgi:hypothetical protein
MLFFAALLSVARRYSPREPGDRWTSNFRNGSKN